jgi:hypothetical protein
VGRADDTTKKLPSKDLLVHLKRKPADKVAICGLLLTARTPSASAENRALIATDRLCPKCAGRGSG